MRLTRVGSKKNPVYRVVVADRGLRALDQRQHVAHAENAPGHAVRVEPLERVQLLTD